MDDRLVKALLDIYNQQEEATEKFNKYWYEVERVVNPDILNSFADVEQALFSIQSIVTNALGGAGEVVRLQEAQEQEARQEVSLLKSPACRTFLLDDAMLDKALEARGAYTGHCVVEVFLDDFYWDKTVREGGSALIRFGDDFHKRFLLSHPIARFNEDTARYLSGAYNLVFFGDDGVFEWALLHVAAVEQAESSLQFRCVGTVVVDSRGRVAHARNH